MYLYSFVINPGYRRAIKLNSTEKGVSMPLTKKDVLIGATDAAATGVAMSAINGIGWGLTVGAVKLTADIVKRAFGKTGD